MSNECNKCNDTGWFFPYPRQILESDFVARFPCECGRGDPKERELFNALIRPMIPQAKDLVAKMEAVVKRSVKP